MSRRRFQHGSVTERGRKTKYWEGGWREYEPGSSKPIRRSVKLGLKSEMSYSDAERKLTEILHEVNSPDHLPESSITLKEFWQTYQELVFPVRKYSTKKDMIGELGRHVLPELGARPLKTLNREALQMFFNRMSRKGASWNTRKKVKIYLSSVVTAAVEYGYLNKNEVRLVDLGTPPVQIQPKLPSVEELRKIQGALPNEKYRMLFRLIWATGGRPGEISAIRWKALQLDEKRVWILESVYGGVLDRPKTHRSVRPVYLDKALVSDLKRYRCLFPNATQEDFVFPSRSGKTPVRYTNVLRRWIRPIWKKLGLTRTTWHLLRHWTGTQMAGKRVPLRVLQEMLGHASIATTMKYYVHADEKAHRAAASVIARTMGRKEKRPGAR